MQEPLRSNVTTWLEAPSWLWTTVVVGAAALGVIAVLLPLVYVVAILVGLVVTALIFWQPAIGAGIYVFMVYSRLLEYIPQLQEFRIMLLLSSLLGVSVFLRSLFTKDGWWFGGVIRNVIFIGAAAAASVPLAVWKSNSFDMFAEFVKVIVGVILVANSIRTEKQLVWFLRLLALMFFWISMTVIWNYLTGNVTTPGEIRRAKGIGAMLADANDIAAVLLMLASVAIYGIRYDTAIAARLAYLAFLPIGMVALVYTGSRGGFLGLVWLLLILVLTSSRRMLLMALGVILLIVVWFAAPPSWRERMLSIKEYQQDESAMARIHLWNAAKEMVKHNPITGIGIGNFEDFAASYGARSWQVAHNTYYHILGETGLLGLAAFVAYLLSIWRFAFTRSMRTASDQSQWLARGIGMGYLVYALPIYFLSVAYYSHTYLPAAILAAGQRLQRIPQREEV